MIQINLVPDVKLELVRTQRHRRVVISSAVIILIATTAVTAMLGIYVFGLQNLMKSSNHSNITQLDAEFQAIDDVGKTVTISNQFSKINGTHDAGHKAMTSRIFDVLAAASSKGTDNSVSITSISLDTEMETISITAQTDKKGFDAAEVFKKNIESMTISYVKADQDGSIPDPTKENVERFLMAKEVNLSDLSSGKDEKDSRQKVSFKLSFVYDPLLFSSELEVVSIEGLAEGNVTDSYTRLPDSLFSTSEDPEEDGAK